MSGFTEGVMIVLAVGGIFLYFPINRIHAPATWYFQDTWLDKRIPLVPYFVIPYIALYPYIVATMLLVLNTPSFPEAYVAIAIAAWTAALFWYLFPAGILRKRIARPDFFSHMIVWLYKHDNENNTIPSSHVFYALICSYYLAHTFPSYALLFAACGALISVSTVLVKQHHIVDILGGIVWAVGAIWLAQTFVA